MNTPIPAVWIDTVFSPLDDSVLSFLHRLTVETQAFFVQPFVYWGAITDNGIVFIVLGGVLVLRRSTRALGIQLAVSVALAGALAYAVKLTVGRPRPLLDPEYSLWWQSLGLPVESGFSFPSGHTATALAAATVLFLWFDKRWSGVFFLVALFTGLTRCTLLVHYPSDVLGGMVVGCLAAALALLALRRVGVNS